VKAGTNAALSRRGFLTRTAGVAAASLAAGGLGSLLTGCDSGALDADLLRDPKPPGPYHPILWPVRVSNRPIPGGQIHEQDATLRIYTWPGRIAKRCLDNFARKYGCVVEVRTFDTMSDALATVTSGRARYDVFCGVDVRALGALMSGNLLQPLNHDYVPNIGEVWPTYTNPFYDQQWLYTVPYSIYKTGIGWRKDLVDIDPYTVLNGWEVLWDAKFANKIAVLDDYREGVSLGLLKTGVTNLNTPDPRQIDDAARALSDLVGLVRPKLDNNAYTGLATGQTWIQHAWSGQVAGAAKFLPKGTPAGALGYWFPPNGSGPVANDLMVILRSAKNPVLAHLFLNFMLKRKNAIRNIKATGYMQPIIGLTPSRLVSDGVLPQSLISTAVLQNDFYRGLKELQLTVVADALWQQAWKSAVSKMNLMPARPAGPPGPPGPN
jgi:spermidine/putrescine transport system substrate-binding protein